MLSLFVVACLLVTVALSACVVVFFFLLWETRRTLLSLNDAIATFATVPRNVPLLMEEAVSSLREIRTAVDGQASRRRYTRPGRREDQPMSDDEGMPARKWENPLDEVAREGAEVGNVG